MHSTGSARHARAARGRSALRRLTDPVRASTAPGLSTAWSIAGETLLSIVLGLLSAVGDGLFQPPPGVGTFRLVAVGLTAALLSLLRRRFPATVLLLITVIGTEVTGLYPLLCVSAWSAGRRIDSARKAAATFAAAYALGIGLLCLQDMPSSFAMALPTLVQLLVMMVVPGFTSRYWAQRRVLTDVVRAYHTQLLRERTMVAGQARMRERQRIAQDMHDSLGHHLTLISVHLNALDVDRTLTAAQRQAIGMLRGMSLTAMRELRDVVGLLRDHNPTEGPGHQIASAAAKGIGEEHLPVPPPRGAARIESLVKESRDAGITVELLHHGEPRPLPAAADHAAYRIAQEGLTNAHKHAPTAPISVELCYEPHALLVKVTNGPVPPSTDTCRSGVSGGQGLIGLRERTQLIGGTLRAGPTPGGGFRLTGLLPYVPPQGGISSPLHEDPDATSTESTDAREQVVAVPADGNSRLTDGTGLPKELTWALSSSAKRSSIAATCGIAGVFLLFFLPLINEIPAGLKEMNNLTPRQQYEAVQVGMTEIKVRDLLSHEAASLTYSPGINVPPEPDEAECLTLPSAEPGSDISKRPVFRFCFKNGTLIEKRNFEISL